ncbi:glycosyltransferase family A protein [Gimibacter soli]|uniref:Glycosyltransferase family A protein n=1 Tax=Gimibacter soli TaxID=3024400 RepID=A0AAF0BL73_9PROT|nr:glycosyltransferase family A protein [Gimibacter soli]WCL55124.1 glycosyltransferase family A protein [Gimibacter soli]
MQEAALTRSEKTLPVGVVIPAYGHPQFLAETIASACEQTCRFDHYVVVVDDECRYEDTRRVTQELMALYPGRLFYLRQPNTRLPGARNAGIRFLMDLLPDLDAIFLLDADNRLAPWALQRYRDILGDDPAVGWAYPDIAFFGMNRVDGGVDIRETAPEYSRLKHLVSNLCEAGSMVRASLFRDGVFFDEAMKYGLEDWDFWLSAVEAGYTGVRARDCGFFYRRRPESMIADAQRHSSVWLDKLQSKHASLTTPRMLVKLEHEEAPAFAIWLVDTGEVILTSDPMAKGRTVSLEAFQDECRAWLEKPDETFVPTHLIAMDAAVWETLRTTSRMLRLLFWQIRDHSDAPRYYRFGNAASFSLMRGGAAPERAVFAVWAMDTFRQAVAAGVMTGPSAGGIVATPEGLEVELPTQDGLHLHLEGLFKALLPKRQQLHARGRRFSGPFAQTVREELQQLASFSAGHHPYPCLVEDRRRVVVVADIGDVITRRYWNGWGRLVEALSPKADLVLAVEGSGTFDIRHLGKLDHFRPFTEVLPMKWSDEPDEYALYMGERLPHEGGIVRTLAVPFQQADAVIAAGSVRSLELFGLVRSQGVPGYVYLDPELAVVGADGDGSLAVVRALEHAIAGIWTDDQDVRDALIAGGVPGGKITSVHRGLQPLSE